VHYNFLSSAESIAIISQYHVVINYDLINAQDKFFFKAAYYFFDYMDTLRVLKINK
jgi:hypothetical protein